MVDSRFFTSRGPFTLADIAERTGSSLSNAASGDVSITGVASLETAGDGDISFLIDKKRLKDFQSSNAVACFVSADSVDDAPTGMAVLINKDPRLAFAIVSTMLFPEAEADGQISASANIAPSAEIGEGTTVEPGAVIEAGASVGSGCIIGANSVIGPNVVLGDGCRISKNVSITHSIIGNNVIVHSGASLGQDGFGYVQDGQGLRKVPQLGRLIVHDDVEIGANSAVDRGTSDDTVIGQGTKIDNLVQIGHNCRVGRYCILCGQSGLAGSVTLGDGVVIGGQVAVVDHCHVESGARVGGKSGVTRRVAAGTEVLGYPAKPAKEWRLEQIALKRLGKEIQAKRKPRKSDDT